MSNPTATRSAQPSLAVCNTSLSSKITAEHLQRRAVLYIRQSTSAQLRDHQESTARQYALKSRLNGLGWLDDRVIVIDDDLGVSGSGSVDRPGFRRLLKLTTDQEVGIVLGLEMSRLARNSKDWHDLFEVCAIFHTLIADEDGVFDPQDPNDRLVLGLKGIIAEMELYTMKVRLGRGRMNKAQRGELFHHAPVGYVLDEHGLPQFDPDESARHAIAMFFDLFDTLGSSNRLFNYLVEHNIMLPFRTNRRSDRSGRINWRLPSKSAVYELLKHPLYAGAYGYGTTRRYRKRGAYASARKYLPPDQWQVLIKDLHPAYISWDQYEAHQQRLKDNDSRGGHRGPVRNGSALLAGIVRCAHCGRRLSPSYPQRGYASYACSRHLTVAHAESCHSYIRCATLDGFVTDKVLEALAPAGIDLSLKVIEDEQSRREQLETMYVHRLKQAQYAADLAERRYKHIDPANRLVADRLEHDWEAALGVLAEAGSDLDKLRHQQPVTLSDDERQRLRAACNDIALLWHEGASVDEKKEIVRLLLQRVDIDVRNNSDVVNVRLQWSGGFESCYSITRTVTTFQQMDVYDDLMDRILQLTLAGESRSCIASILEREGYRSPRNNRRISAMMVEKLMLDHPRCREQLNRPVLDTDHWHSVDLAKELGVKEKQLKQWVTRGWATAVQRPFARAWVIFADAQELDRLKRLAASRQGRGCPAPPPELRTPRPMPQTPRKTES